MTTFGKTLTWGIAVVIIIVGLIFLFVSTGGMSANPTPAPASSPSPTAIATATPSSSPLVSLGNDYSNTDLGFSFSYPKTFSVVPQNFMDTTGAKTLLILADADKSETIHVSVLMDPKTGKPIPPSAPGYENALMNNVIYDGSGAQPKSFSEFQLRQFADARFAFVQTGLYEGVLGVSYYAAVPGGIIKFSLVSTGVDWTNPKFDPEQDSGHLALKAILATFRVGAYGSAAPTVSYVPYSDPSGAYSVDVPSGWMLNKKFSYDAIGPDKSIPGVSFSIPSSFTAATNLSTDSYISIEKNPYAASCLAAEFTSTGITNPDATQITIGGIIWNVGESTDVGAGNYYNERIYAAKSGSDCYGIRLFLHSGNVDNYDAGAVQQFDKNLLEAIQDKVASSFSFASQQ